MKVTVLGCGGSGGVPIIGPDGPNWGVCDPTEPRNRRRRVSVLVEVDGARILIDTAPELREQLLDAGCGRLDAVIYTHYHADHMHGLDDLRAVCRNIGRPVPVWGDAATLEEIRTRFGYALTPIRGTFFYKPQLEPHVIDGPFEAAGVKIVPFTQDHGVGLDTLGFRIGAFAYSTDVQRMPEEAFTVLAGIDTWVVDCVQEAPHAAHSHLEQTLGWISRVKPRRAVLTHMNQTLDYRTLAAKLPAGVEPGYDGMVLDVA